MSATDPFHQMDAHVNPYAAPRADLEAPPLIVFEGDQAQCEAIRRTYLGRETWIKLIGSFHYLGAGFGFLGLCSITVLALGGMLNVPMAIAFVLVAVYGVLTAVNAVLGYGLRALQPWARWTEAVLYGIGLAVGCLLIVGSLVLRSVPLLMAYSFSSIVQGAVLYLLLSHA